MTLPVWTPAPERVQQSTMTRFIAFVNRKHGTAFTEYNGLYRWSVTDFPTFWGAMWEFGEVIASRPYDRVVDDPTRMPGARWFEGARLNFAQNLLRFRDDRTAVVFRGEGGESNRLNYRELYLRVARLAHALRRAGVVPGDRVAATSVSSPT